MSKISKASLQQQLGDLVAGTQKYLQRVFKGAVLTCDPAISR